MEATEIAEKPWLWNGEKAKEMSAKANAARWSRFKEKKEKYQSPRDEIGIPDSDPMRNETLAQIRDLDQEYAKAKDLADKLKIAGIKEKLWRLLYPSPGSLKPKTPTKRQSSNSPEPEAI